MGHPGIVPDEREEPAVLVSCLGDIMLDVIVDAPHGLVEDDDTPARITFAAGGQAANVAAWVTALGARARVFGPRSHSGNGRLVEEVLAGAGVEVHGPFVAQSGTVMSLITEGSRSMASDPGTTDWLDAVAPGPWLQDADWLFVSGYALLRAANPEQIVALAHTARAAGTRVSVDLSSAAMIEDFGAGRFARLWQAMRPDVVFANDQEWAATSGGDLAPEIPSGVGGSGILVLKHGAAGCTFVSGGIVDPRSPVPGPVRDVTGAGDSLTAGFLLGGPGLAMEAAARCVAQVGAQPRGAGARTP